MKYVRLSPKAAAKHMAIPQPPTYERPTSLHGPFYISRKSLDYLFLLRCCPLPPYSRYYRGVCACTARYIYTIYSQLGEESPVPLPYRPTITISVERPNLYGGDDAFTHSGVSDRAAEGEILPPVQ